MVGVTGFEPMASWSRTTQNVRKINKIGKRHNFDTKFSEFFIFLPRYRYAFLIWRSRGVFY